MREEIFSGSRSRNDHKLFRNRAVIIVRRDISDNRLIKSKEKKWILNIYLWKSRFYRKFHDMYKSTRDKKMTLAADHMIIILEIASFTS